MKIGWRYEDEWFEETNVSIKIKEFLESKDYDILKFSFDKTEKGHDIEATKEGEHFILEVKGYPSDKYVSGPNKGLKKRTNPKLQAEHWFAEALLSLVIAKSKELKCHICMGLPDMLKYRELINKSKILQERLSISYFLVEENGKVVLQ